jgi:hypothetical protein
MFKWRAWLVDRLFEETITVRSFTVSGALKKAHRRLHNDYGEVKVCRYSRSKQKMIRGRSEINP